MDETRRSIYLLLTAVAVAVAAAKVVGAENLFEHTRCAIASIDAPNGRAAHPLPGTRGGVAPTA